LQVRAQLRSRRVTGGRPRRDDEVHGRQFILAQAEALANEAPDAIARHGVADSFRCNRESEPRVAELVRSHDGLEECPPETLPALIDMIELRLVAEALAGTERERPDRIPALRVRE